MGSSKLYRYLKDNISAKIKTCQNIILKFLKKFKNGISNDN